MDRAVNEANDNYPDTSIEPELAAYLRAHPDFFERHPDLLAALKVPHPCGSAVSLIERQLHALREQNRQLRKKLTELVDVARDNDRICKQTQRLALMLIETNELDEILYGIKALLRDEFNAEFSTLRLLTQHPASTLSSELESLTPPALGLFDALLRAQSPRCGALTPVQAEVLFGEAAAEVVSAALVPLQGAAWQGLLALGSRNSQRFQPGMGTLFLRHMGELISHALHPHLEPVVLSNDSSYDGQVE